jgi:cytochrome c-type biogenesis protein CcmH
MKSGNNIVIPAEAGVRGFGGSGAAWWVPVLARTGGGTHWRRASKVLWLLFSLCTLLSASPALAVRPDEMLVDPKLEARARDVSKDLRCLVCRNQSLDDSDADLAHDLRVLVRERIKAGDTNDETLAYVRARYGDFVLLKPPLQTDTLLLWGGPLLILLLGAFAARRFYRGRAVMPAPPPLSADEQQRLATILKGSEP